MCFCWALQDRQYKALKAHILQTTPKDEQKVTIRKLKEEKRRKMALLGDTYEQTITEMLQKQSVSHPKNTKATLIL